MREEKFERELDAALARYAAVEPRAGLEQRVLARLRAENAPSARFEWQRWAVAVVAVAAVLAVWSGRRPAGVDVNPATMQHQTAKAGGSLLATVATGDSGKTKTHDPLERGLVTAHAQLRRKPKSARANADAAPRLAQFPAPEPLTEQEKLLIRFVENDPEDAELVAEVTAKRLEEEADRVKGLESGTNSE